MQVIEVQISRVNDHDETEHTLTLTVKSTNLQDLLNIVQSLQWQIDLKKEVPVPAKDDDEIPF